MFSARHVPHSTLIVASLLMASCGSSNSNNNEPTAPVLTGGPPSTILFEGGAEDAVPLHVSPKCVDVAVESSDGVEATATASKCGGEEGGSVDPPNVHVRVRAPFGVTGERTVVVVLKNQSAEARVNVTVDVKPARWSPQQTWTDGPEAREHGAIIRDDANKRVLLIGGSGYKPYGTPLNDIWAWSLTEQKWSKPAVEGDVPSAAGSRRVAMDGSRAYLFGGYGDGSAVNDELIRVELGDPIRFKKLAHPGPIPARSLHAFARAPDGFIVFGGAAGKPLNDTWKLKIEGDTVTMTKLETPVAPTARYGFFYGGDDKRLVIFSGAQSFSTVKAAVDSWAFDFATNEWTQIAVDDPNAPKGRRNGCFVFDEQQSQLFVFGGTADAMNTEPGFYVLDARAGREAWSKLEREGEPPLRSSGFGFWDPTARTATCGFGNTTKAVYADWTSFGG